MTDSLGAVMDDAKRVFEFRDDSRPQDRAHEYLTRNRVLRGFNDTAMICAVDDMLRRAHAIGVADADSGAAKAPEGVEYVDTGACGRYRELGEARPL